MLWPRFWMQFAGLGPIGRLATWFAIIGAPPHSARKYLRTLNTQGFISPHASIYHNGELKWGNHVWIDDRALIFQGNGGGPVELGERVSLWRDVMLQTGPGGSIRIGTGTGVHPRCVIIAMVAPIEIGCGVGIAENCALYSYDHGIAADVDFSGQVLHSKGAIRICDGAWLGAGVSVLSGVTIGKGAVIGAGAVVTHDIPDGAVAVGMPARVIKMRDEIESQLAGVGTENVR